MNIQFRQGSEELSSKLVDRAQIKLAKLSRLIVEDNSEALVHVDVEKESGSRNSDSMWRSTINMDLAGSSFTAAGSGNTPDKATELAIKELKREVRKAKEKRKSVARRGSELLKRLRRGA